MKTILITFIYYWEILRSLFSGKILYQYFLQFFRFIFFEFQRIEKYKKDLNQEKPGLFL